MAKSQQIEKRTNKCCVTIYIRKKPKISCFQFDDAHILVPSAINEKWNTQKPTFFKEEEEEKGEKVKQEIKYDTFNFSSNYRF